MKTAKESRPTPRGGNQGHAISDNQSIPDLGDTAQALEVIELALLGHALHARSTALLPAPECFTPGARRELARTVHHIARTGQVVDANTVRLHLARDPRVPRAGHDCLVDAITHGGLTFEAQSRQYKSLLEAEHRRTQCAQHLTRAKQLLAAADDTEAANELAAALKTLEAAQ